MRTLLLALLTLLVGTTPGLAQAEPKRDIHGLTPGLTISDVITRLKEIGVGPNLYFATEESDGWEAFCKIHKISPGDVEDFRQIGCISGSGGKGDDFTEVTCYKERDFYKLDFTRYLAATHLKKVSYNSPSGPKGGEMMKSLRRQYRLGNAKPDSYGRFNLGDGFIFTGSEHKATSRYEIKIISTHLYSVDAEAGNLEKLRSNPETGF